MTWQQWVLIGLFLMGMVNSVLRIGREQQPVTPGTAAVAVLIYAALIWMTANMEVTA
ncbi:hypothetical protein BACT_1103 [Bifidobacterium actinocoloniiforme DSM 22766]|uniref:Uncharacterized protein n=1 Tax=Bifidobacterium actinocoloniiforme DSM 22766 TaxID=1437605 RepID=A0A086Z1K1_9BIFI|nr:hypothetical protein [Bifidobacterium actinocoloniiforme]KFI40401.1 hypothetical protein BACT_1103 [Bifidobacterium actinocoloniiforme DSM 22766]